MTSRPHDALFKSVFQNPEHAAAELRHILPGELALAIDWSSLRLEPGSYVDPSFAGQESDLLFSAVSTRSGETVLVYLLFEHQSTSDWRMPLRMLGYMVNIWTRYADEHLGKPLPVIVPALLAQVPGGWAASNRFSDMFSVSARKLGGSVIPDFAFAIDDLYFVTDEDLRRREVADQAKVALWLMRDIRDAAALSEHIVGWADVLERLARSPGGEEAVGLLLRYVALSSSALRLSEFCDKLSGRAPAVEAIAMTIEEMLEAKAIAHGVARGRVEKAVAAIFTVLDARDLHVSDAVRNRIEGCTDQDSLDEWLARAATAKSADEIFGT